MIFIKPTEIDFESENDVIDYVSKGIAPMRKDFDNLISMISDEDTAPYCMSGIIDKDRFIDGLTRVYENNCRKRNALVIGLGVITIASIAGAAAYRKHIRETEVIEVTNFISNFEDECNQLLNLAAESIEN
jgi:hypothetical protein